MRVGIDVGGTNTDAVLIDGDSVAAAAKWPTSPDVTSGIVGALAGLHEHRPFAAAGIDAVMIGTTHFINALVEGQRLAPTAAVRLGLPATASLPPFAGWPPRLVKAMAGRPYLAHGGHEFDGRVITPIDADELKRHAADMAGNGVRSLAISSVFSPVNNEFELCAADILAAELGPDVAISLSHEIGRLSLLERENGTIINAALRELAGAIIDGLTASLHQGGITAPLYLSQNDGTLMEVEYARKYPVATFASGPANSMRGAAALSGLDTCAVVDIGGTTSDVGVLVRGFPRQARGEVCIAGVRTKLRMPDMLSIGVGGGSLVSDDGAVVGPASVGYRLPTEALVFGGHTFTATDAAVAAGRAMIGEQSRVGRVDPAAARRALRVVAEGVAAAVQHMRPSATPLPLVAVGGGSVLLPDEFAGLGRIRRPEHYSVANAIGATIAQVSGETDKVYAITRGRWGDLADEAKQDAVDKAIAAGADPSSVQVTDLDQVLIPYLPGNAIRIRAKAVGDLALSRCCQAAPPVPR